MNLQKGRSGDGVSTDSPMIKSAMERKKEEVEIVGIAYLLLWAIFPIYRVRFPNLRSYFRNKICFSLLRIILLWDKICFSLPRIILLRDNICFPYEGLSFQIKDLEIEKFRDKYILYVFSHIW